MNAVFFAVVTVFFSEIPIWLNLETGFCAFCSAFGGRFYGNPFSLYETSKIAVRDIHFLHLSVLFDLSFKNTVFCCPYFIVF